MMTLLLLFLVGAQGQLIMPTSYGVFYDLSTVNVCGSFAAGSTGPVLAYTNSNLGPVPPLLTALKNPASCYPAQIMAPMGNTEGSVYHIEAWSNLQRTSSTGVSYNFLVYQFPFVPQTGGFVTSDNVMVILPLVSRHAGRTPFPVPLNTSDAVQFVGYDMYYKPNNLVYNKTVGIAYATTTTVINFNIPNDAGTYYWMVRFVSGLTQVVTDSVVGFKRRDANYWDPFSLTA